MNSLRKLVRFLIEANQYAHQKYSRDDLIKYAELYKEKFQNEFDSTLAFTQKHFEHDIDPVITLRNANNKAILRIHSGISYNYQTLKDFHGKRKQKTTPDIYEWHFDFTDTDVFIETLKTANNLHEFEIALNNAKRFDFVKCSRQQKRAMEAFVNSNVGKTVGAVLVDNKKSKGYYTYEHAVVGKRTKYYSLCVIPPFDEKRTRKQFGERDDQIVFISKDMAWKAYNGHGKPYITLSVDKFIQITRVCNTINEFEILAFKLGKAATF